MVEDSQDSENKRPRVRDMLKNLNPFRRRKLVEVPDQIIRVVTHNIRGCIGPEKQGFFNSKTEEQVMGRLEKLAQLYAEISADVICLQEVDFNSRRTQYINQPRVLARRLKELTGVDYQISEKINVERPEKFPHIEETGKLSFGNATLSRFPIVHEHSQFFTKWYQQNGFRALVRLILQRDERKSFLATKIEIPGYKYPVTIVNTHFDNKKKELRQTEPGIILKYLQNRGNGLEVLAGDLNAVLPWSPRFKDFKKLDRIGDNDNYENDPTMDTLLASELIRFPESLREENQPVNGDGRRVLDKRHFTYHCSQPTRTLDYILLGKGLHYARYADKDTKEYVPYITPLYSGPSLEAEDEVFGGTYGGEPFRIPGIIERPSIEECYYTLESMLVSDHLPVVADIVIPRDYRKQTLDEKIRGQTTVEPQSPDAPLDIEDYDR